MIAAHSRSKLQTPVVVVPEAVALERLEHGPPEPGAEGVVVKVALSREPSGQHLAVVGDLGVVPGGVVPHLDAARVKPDGGSDEVVGPAPELALGDEEPDPVRLELQPVVVRWYVEAVGVLRQDPGRKLVVDSFDHGLPPTLELQGCLADSGERTLR